MTLLPSLRSRIFLASALLAVLSISAAIYLVSVRVTRELEASMQREIASTRSLVEQLRTTRAQTFAMMARLIADAPKLKAAVDTNDPATVQDTANDYQNQLNSNLLLVTSRTGDVLATVGGTSRTAVMVASLPAVRNAIGGRESLSLVPQPDGILHLVTVPITIGLTHPDILGSLGVGFLLDDGFARQLKQITGSEIAFGMNGQILASTLPERNRPALSSLLSDSAQATHDITLDSAEYMTMALPLSGAGDASAPGGGAVALILRSRTEQLRFLREIHTELAVTAVVAVLLATLLSFAVARTITRPLAAITGVMRDVAATGDLTRKIVLPLGHRWDDEDARLLATTFNGLTESVARAHREMAQKDRLSSLGRLSTVIAHEVRNPLMIIKAALHTLRAPEPGLAAVRDAATDINGEVARLNRIVNDVLDFARPIQFEWSPVELNALCRESAAAAAAGESPAIEVDLDPSVAIVVTDPERLRIALVNLLVNARDAAGEVEPPRVSLTTHRHAASISIVITDRGTGIATSDLPQIFDPYFTTKRGGTGLGLPIARNIVEGLGGTLAVKSERGRGTEFRIDLPLAAAGDRSAAAGGAPTSPLSPQATDAAPGLRIDEPRRAV